MRVRRLERSRAASAPARPVDGDAPAPAERPANGHGQRDLVHAPGHDLAATPDQAQRAVLVRGGAK